MNRTDLWDDGWSFRKTALGVTYEEALAGEFTAVDIPHDWLIYDTHNLYESSTGWYRKSFTLTKEQLGKKLRRPTGVAEHDSGGLVHDSLFVLLLTLHYNPTRHPVLLLWTMKYTK